MSKKTLTALILAAQIANPAANAAVSPDGDISHAGAVRYENHVDPFLEQPPKNKYDTIFDHIRKNGFCNDGIAYEQTISDGSAIQAVGFVDQGFKVLGIGHFWPNKKYEVDVKVTPIDSSFRESHDFPMHSAYIRNADFSAIVRKMSNIAVHYAVNGPPQLNPADKLSLPAQKYHDTIGTLTSKGGCPSYSTSK